MRQVYDKIKYLVGSREILEGMERIKVLPLFSDQALDFLECLSKRLMSSNEAKKYPDVIAYAFWIRRASLEKARNSVSNSALEYSHTIRHFPDLCADSRQRVNRADIR